MGKLADLVLWKPEFFGAHPELILKGGYVAWAQMGDPNASIPTPQPVYGRPMFAAQPSSVQSSSRSSIVFMSQVSIDQKRHETYGLRKRVEAVRNCRKVGKRDMKLNYYLPMIKVNPETYEVTVDGELIVMQPAERVSLAHGYHLF